MHQKGHCNANSASTLGTHSITVAMHLNMWNVGSMSPQSSSCGDNCTANYHVYSKWKEAKAAAAKQAQGECS
jgi:hypothetical protein